MAQKKMNKRTWHYIHPPEFYECMCENDPRLKANPADAFVQVHKIAWSEYAGMIWCYVCETDQRGFGGVFDGPIPFKAALMLMGETCFHRYYIEKRAIYRPHISKKTGKIHYQRDRKLTRQARKQLSAAGH